MKLHLLFDLKKSLQQPFIFSQLFELVFWRWIFVERKFSSKQSSPDNDPIWKKGTRDPFLESPCNFSGPKSNIQIEI